MSAFFAMKANLICFAPQRTGWPFLTPPSPPAAYGSLSAAPRSRARDRTGRLASQDCADLAGSNGSASRSRRQNPLPPVYAVARWSKLPALPLHGIPGEEALRWLSARLLLRLEGWSTFAGQTRRS